MSFCMKSLWRKTQVRPPKVKFGRRTCMRFGGTLGPRKHEWGKSRFGRRTSGSAAEPHVRPPNMACMRRHIRPPNVAWTATIKGSLSRKRASFSPFSAKVSSPPSLTDLWCFSSRSFKFFICFNFVLKIWAFEQSFGALRFKNSNLSQLQVWSPLLSIFKR